MFSDLFPDPKTAHGVKPLLSWLTGVDGDYGQRVQQNDHWQSQTEFLETRMTLLVTKLAPVEVLLPYSNPLFPAHRIFCTGASMVGTGLWTELKKVPPDICSR